MECLNEQNSRGRQCSFQMAVIELEPPHPSNCASAPSAYDCDKLYNREPCSDVAGTAAPPPHRPRPHPSPTPSRSRIRLQHSCLTCAPPRHAGVCGECKECYTRAIDSYFPDFPDNATNRQFACVPVPEVRPTGPLSLCGEAHM